MSEAIPLNIDLQPLLSTHSPVLSKNKLKTLYMEKPLDVAQLLYLGSKQPSSEKTNKDYLYFPHEGILLSKEKSYKRFCIIFKAGMSNPWPAGRYAARLVIRCGPLLILTSSSVF